jgi:hypothetical protein
MAIRSLSPRALVRKPDEQLAEDDPLAPALLDALQRGDEERHVAERAHDEDE